MQLPKLTPIRAERQIINKFLGYNHNAVVLDGANKHKYGEWYDVSGLTSDEYPTAAVRKPHGGMPLLGSGFVTGLFVARGKIGYTRGSSIYFYTGALSDNGYSGYDLGLDNNAKQIIAMGAYRIILPDKKYINVENPGTYGHYDYGDWNPTVTCDDHSDDYFLSLDACLEDGTVVTYTHSDNGTPPDPTSYQYWYDRKNGLFKHYDADTAEWVTITPYQLINFGQTVTIPHEVGRQIKISATLSSATGTPQDGPMTNGVTRLIKTGRAGTQNEKTYIVVPGNPISATYRTWSVTLSYGMPDMDYMIECENRLWGCKYGEVNGQRVNEIYASALGDMFNWNVYEGTSQDSYTVSVGTDGPFTGACAFGGKPHFFKENVMHRVYGSYPAQYQVQTTEVQGVESGAWRSLAIVNNVLYYKSRAGIMAYDGASPVMISSQFGAETYTNATAGGHKGKYFLTMMKEDTEYVTFIYDISRRIWDKHDNVKGLSASFGAIWQSCGDEMYATIIDTAFSTVREWYGTDNADASPVEWYAETGDLGLDSPDRKRVTRLTLRMKMNVGSYVKIYVKYDDGEWEQQGNKAGYNLRTFSLPIRVKRCDHFRLRFEGSGYCQIYSIARTIEGGSDL